MGPRTLWQAWRRMGPYRRSHHPLCGPFRADILVVRGQRYCIACYVGYPALAVAGVLAFLLLPLREHWLAWAGAGLAIALPQALSFAGRVPDWKVQVAVKACLGAGFGLTLAAVLSAPFAWWARLLLALAVMSGLNTLWLFRFHRLERTCQACPQLPSRPRCEGLRELDDRVGALLGTFVSPGQPSYTGPVSAEPRQEALDGPHALPLGDSHRREDHH